jgi:hypothetical protein
VRSLASTAPEALARTAQQTGLQGRIVLVEAADSFSFVYGVMTPRVAVSRGLLEHATPDELRAVLEHERYHVRNIDPLKAMIVSVLSAALFFLPALNSLRTRYVAGRELAADRRALVACSVPRSSIPCDARADEQARRRPDRPGQLSDPCGERQRDRRISRLSVRFSSPRRDAT